MEEKEVAATETADIEATAAVEEEKPLSPEEVEHAAAVARGDVIVQPKEEVINPDILAEIAGKTDDKTEQTVAIEEKEDDSTIPRARFNEVNNELKVLKERLAALETNRTTDDAAVVQENNPSPFELLETKRDELQDKADAMLVEGQLEERRELLKEIRKIDKTLAKAEIMADLSQQTTQSRAAESMNEVAAKAYEIYPFLDIDSDACDMDAVNSVVTRRDELFAKGMTAAQALQTAVDEKGPKFARLLGTATPSTETSKADEVRAARERAAKERAANASIGQPVTLPNKAEKDSFAVNVDTLSKEQIKAIPEEEKARLRGDIL